MRSFSQVFPVFKPVIGVIHLKGKTPEEILKRAQEEISAYVSGGLNGVLIENYFGHYFDMERVLNWLQANPLPVPLGVNVLGHDAMGFELAKKYQVQFMQVDSVIGHVSERNEKTLEAFFDLYRSRVDVCLIGGVRFKYQPVLSKRSLKEDLLDATKRCDAICVTGDATGQETDLKKIREFRSILPDFPLIVGAGTTKDNISAQLKYCDGAIVGSTFKDSRKDTGDVSLAFVQEFMQAVEACRKEYQ